MPLILLATLALGVMAALLGPPWWRAHQRRQIARQAFPTAWRKLLRRRVPLVQRLPAALQLQLKKHMMLFIAEKPILGCGGLVVTDEMRVVIAAQACLLILNRSTRYFEGVRHILLYPGAFAVNRSRVDAAGVTQEQREVLAGESWSQGQVILSWQDTLEGAATPDDGRNVVIHEFAHQLDQENGAAHGAPPPAPGDTAHNPARWSAVFHAAYDRLRNEAWFGKAGLINPYGAQDPAEFFAVVSEVFFEQGAALLAHDAALYQELSGYYKVDPAGW